MFRKKLMLILSGILALSLVLSACSTRSNGGNGGNGSDPSPGTTQKQPDFGGEIVYQVPDDPDTLAVYWLASSYAAYVTDRVFGPGLLRIGYDLTPEEALAESYEVSPDQLTYTFKLRKGVKFHDGVELTSKDVKFTYDLLMSDDYKGPRKSNVAQVASVEAPDSHTVVFKTKEIFAPFLFTTALLEIVPAHKLEGADIATLQSHDFWKHPIGTGPWKFVEWRPSQFVLMERNADYWEMGNPGINGGTFGPWADKLRVQVIKDNNTAISALEAGELSYMSSVSASQVDRLKEQLKNTHNAYDWDRMGYGYQTFNNAKFPTNIKEVRQALSHALDRETILKGVLDNKATIPSGFVPPVHWVFDPNLKGYDYDPAKAEQLIQQAGFTKNANGIYEKDGQPLKLQYVATQGNDTIDGIALQSKNDWLKIGVETELIMVDFNTLLDRHLIPGDYHVTFSGLGFTVDPHNSFNIFHSREIRPNDLGHAQGSNRSRYSNPQVDALIDRGRQTVDPAERLKIYHEAQRLIVADAPANWIYVNLWTDFGKKELKGVVNWNGYGMQWMNQWYIREK